MLKKKSDIHLEIDQNAITQTKNPYTKDNLWKDNTLSGYFNSPLIGSLACAFFLSRPRHIRRNQNKFFGMLSIFRAASTALAFRENTFFLRISAEKKSVKKNLKVIPRYKLTMNLKVTAAILSTRSCS